VPKNDSRLADIIHEWCVDQWGHNAPALKTVRDHIREVLKPARHSSPD
jgi:hypothetical protein